MLFDKILKLKDRFLTKRGNPDDVPIIDSWLVEAEKLLLSKSLAEHDGVKFIIEAFTREVEGINKMLLADDSSKLPDYDRDRLLDRRDLANVYLNLFLNLDDKIAKMEDSVDKELAVI